MNNGTVPVRHRLLEWFEYNLRPRGCVGLRTVDGRNYSSLSDLDSSDDSFFFSFWITFTFVGTPSILSMSETLKKLKRQTATQRDKSALLHKARYYVGLIFDSIM